MGGDRIQRQGDAGATDGDRSTEDDSDRSVLRPVRRDHRLAQFLRLSAKNDENLVIVRGNQKLASLRPAHQRAYDHYSWRAYLGSGSDPDQIYKSLTEWKLGTSVQELAFWMKGPIPPQNTRQGAPPVAAQQTPARAAQPKAGKAQKKVAKKTPKKTKARKAAKKAKAARGLRKSPNAPKLQRSRRLRGSGRQRPSGNIEGQSFLFGGRRLRGHRELPLHNSHRRPCATPVHADRPERRFSNRRPALCTAFLMAADTAGPSPGNRPT